MKKIFLILLCVTHFNFASDLQKKSLENTLPSDMGPRQQSTCYVSIDAEGSSSKKEEDFSQKVEKHEEQIQVVSTDQSNRVTPPARKSQHRRTDSCFWDEEDSFPIPIHVEDSGHDPFYVGSLPGSKITKDPKRKSQPPF